MRAFALFLALFAFWVCLSGQTDSTFLMGIGLACCGFTAWLCTRLEIVGDEGQPTRGLLSFLVYIPWLVWQVVLANIDVVRRVWSPTSTSIDPRLFELETELRHPVARTLYANSITLTPGTVTVRCEEGHFIVHALTEGAERALLGGDMEQRIRQMEEASR